jgi:hypothetical protein
VEQVEPGALTLGRAAPVARPSIGHLCLMLFAAAIVLLAWHASVYLHDAVAAIRYPFEMDYGEGIVWQQALLIPGPRMYGDITHFPFIVFHYPPVYHLVVRGVAALGVDFLAAGRGVSVAATIAIGALAGGLSFHATRDAAGLTAALIGATVAGLSVFCYWPVVIWSPLLRVDMLAVALSFLGVWCAVRSPEHPGRMNLAVIAFVLAVYAKQTCIVAPLATFPVMLLVDRRRTLQAAALGLVIAVSALLLLEWMTHGGFLRHILLYNLNRYDPIVALQAIGVEWPQAGFLVLAVVALGVGWRRFRVTHGCNLIAFRQDVRVSRTTQMIAVLTLYFGLSSAMLLTLGKSGSTLNYFIEWMCVWSVLIGTLAATAASRAVAWIGQRSDGASPALALLVPVLLIGQVAIIPVSAAQRFHIADGAWNDQLGRLAAEIRRAKRPVLSDDMVLLLTAGKPVPWEPAIFAELASTGRWDERLIVDMITMHDFAFVITRGHPGSEIYDSRYNPAVSQAIEAAYPYTEEYADRTVHRSSAPTVRDGTPSSQR